MRQYILDSNLYIEADRNESAAEELDWFLMRFLPSVHLHGVVAQELLAGAIDARRERLVHDSLIKPFERRGRVVAPSFEAWKRAGGIRLGRCAVAGVRPSSRRTTPQPLSSPARGTRGKSRPRFS